MPHSQKKEAQKMKTHAQNKLAKANGKTAPPTEEELEHRRKVNIENEKKKLAKVEANKRKQRELEAIGGLDGILKKKDSAK